MAAGRERGCGWAQLGSAGAGTQGDTTWWCPRHSVSSVSPWAGDQTSQGAGSQNRAGAAPCLVPAATLTPGEQPCWHPHGCHVAAGCQDTRRGRSENNRLLMSSFQKEGVAVVGNFGDQWGWLTVSSLVSQALAPMCCQPGWGLEAPQLLGLPTLFRGATAFPATSSCGSAGRTACPAGHPLCGASGGCRACATSCSVLLALGGLCCLAGETAWRGGERHTGAQHLPAPACTSFPTARASHSRAGSPLSRWDPGRLLLTCPALAQVFPVALKPPCGCCHQGSAARADPLPADISIPTALLYPAQHMPVAVCWCCHWFGDR